MSRSSFYKTTDDVPDLESNDTYRISDHQPQVITDEKEFAVNSARSRKNLVVDPKFNQLMQEDHQDELSDSMQAALHLSLDRLSENAYDDDDLTRLKGKKKYPSIPTAQTEKTEPEPAVAGSPVPLSASTVKSQRSVLNDSLTARSFAAPTGTADDENAHGHLAVADSLDITKSDAEQPSFDISSDALRYQEAAEIERQDPYADLRYDPNWSQQRSDDDRADDDLQRAPPSLHAADSDASFRYDEIRLASARASSPQHNTRQQGAITVHSRLLSPDDPPPFDFGSSSGGEPPGFRVMAGRGGDSPVRASADPGALAKMNRKYEEEFSQMLEMERGWQRADEAESQRSEAFLIEEFSGFAKTSPKHPPAIRPSRHTVRPTNETAESKRLPSQIPSIKSVSRRSDSLERQHRKIKADEPPTAAAYVPTPPKAIRSSERNKDYIELNKSRLGRKSSSASYLEMFSKRASSQRATVEQQEKHRIANKNRTRSDSNLKKMAAVRENRPHHHHRDAAKDSLSDVQLRTHNGNSYESEELSLEEAWRKQAQRLKGIRNSDEQQQRRGAGQLQEIGNNFAVGTKPQFSPRRFAHVPDTVQPVGAGESRRARGGAVNRNPGADDDDLSGHPAFTSLPAPHSELRHHHHHHHRRRHRAHDDERSPHRSRAYDAIRHDRHQLHHHASPHRSEPVRLHHSQPPIDDDRYEPTDATGPHPNGGSSPLSKRHVNFVTGKAGVYALPPTPPGHRHHRQAPVTTPPPGGQQLSQVQLSPIEDAVESSRLAYKQQWGGEAAYTGYVHDVVGPSSSHQKPPLPPIRADQQQQQLLPGGAAGVKASPPADADYYSWLRQAGADDIAAVKNEQQRVEAETKKANKPHYKRYTLTDYKNLKKDVPLGGLGPDLSAAREKAERSERARKYAEFVRKHHKTVTAADDHSIVQLLPPFLVTSEGQKKRQQRQEKRERALEYARRVPKPKAAPASLLSPSSDGGKQQPPIAAAAPPFSGRKQKAAAEDEDYRAPEQPPSAMGVDWQLLQSLRERHEREKALVAELSSNRIS